MKSTENKTMALEKSQTNANQTNNIELNSANDDKQLYQNLPIDGTPFNAVKVQEKWFITLGKYKISENFDTYEEAINDSQNTDWIRIMTIMNIIIMNREEELNQQKKK